jgi:hypothetical protein
VDPRGGKRGWPLRADFAVVGLLVILLGAAAGAFVHLRSDEDARQAAEADASFAARKAAAQITSGLDIIKVASAGSTVANAPSLAQDFANPSGCHLGNAPVGAFDTTRIDLVRLDGSVACSSRKPVASGTMFAGQSWLRTTAPAFVAPIVDPLTGRQVAVVSYPVGNLGVIAWFLDLEPVGPKLASEFGSGVDQLEFLVTSSDGKAIIARSIDSRKWIGAAIDGTPFAAASDPVDRNDVNGTPRWYGQASVNAAGWKVYAGADKAVALTDAARLQNQQLEIVGAGVFAVLLALLVVYRRVVRPIEQLSERVVRATTEAGDDLPPTRGPAEVATLANNFNQMMASVKRELAERRRAERQHRSPSATTGFCSKAARSRCLFTTSRHRKSWRQTKQRLPSMAIRGKSSRRSRSPLYDRPWTVPSPMTSAVPRITIDHSLTVIGRRTARTWR